MFALLIKAALLAMAVLSKRDAAALAALAVAAAGATWWLQRRRQERLVRESIERARSHAAQQREADLAELLEAVKAISKSVLYIVSNAKSTAFSGPNLAKYLKMKGLPVYARQGASEQEVLAVNAATLLEHLEKNGDVKRDGVKARHAVIKELISSQRLQALYPEMVEAYKQQPLDYGRNSRYGDKWRISCYLVVMENWKPKIQPHLPMLRCLEAVMLECCEGFQEWYCNLKDCRSVDVHIMNAFVTRYKPIDGEDQLQRHIDGANVDGSVILALPTEDHFHGGALHVWDGKPQRERVYEMQSGDVMFLDTKIWHQAMPITCGTRYALVLFLKLKTDTAAEKGAISF
eukprot:TRINITY_DN52526_c0_g1_i3.p1 TRINITY_DN52526_c0_g1~~TRINITY_DN52526_c0_g1_i3.p1  ORF type:complete len:347 (-),score=69.90 TRINITY_DN52526_c0_g1_i3:69-1109(-)